MRVCIVQPALHAVSETFIRAHAERLPGVVGVVYLDRRHLPHIDDSPVLSQRPTSRARRKVARLLHVGGASETDLAYETAFRRTGADVVLAEYGTTGVRVLRACERTRVPLVVHFHGFDASKHDVLTRHADEYRRMFAQAAAVVAVSRAMEQRLLSLGCPREKLVYNTYGIDCEAFAGASPATAAASFIATGRMVEKKGPYLTLLAFASVLQQFPDARLTFIGGGELLGVCRDLASALAIEHAVTFLGPQPHDVVQQQMRQARAFVQHSLVASSGDSEGTPVAILEAGAIGLPVIATRHAGIPDVVVHDRTGLLVEERDVRGMAGHMLALARDPRRAGELGSNAAAHIRASYTMEHSIRGLAGVLEAATAKRA